MFKFLLSLTLLLALQARAEIVVSNSVKEAQLAAETKCKEQCIVLSPQDIAELEANIQAAVQEAYKAGLKGWSSAS